MYQLPWNLIWTHLSRFCIWDSPLCLSILSPSLSRDTSCCLFTASLCPGHYVKNTSRARKVRIQATAVNQSGSISVAFVCSFVNLQADDAGGPAAGAKDCSSNQRSISQSEDTTSRGVKTECLLLIYRHTPDIVTGCPSWLSSNSQLKGDLNEINENERASHSAHMLHKNMMQSGKKMNLLSIYFV